MRELYYTNEATLRCFSCHLREATTCQHTKSHVLSTKGSTCWLNQAVISQKDTRTPFKVSSTNISRFSRNLLTQLDLEMDTITSGSKDCSPTSQILPGYYQGDIQRILPKVSLSGSPKWPPIGHTVPLKIDSY